MYDRLAQLIGKQFSYLGCDWLLIEIMPELDSLVLRRLGQHNEVQANQHGSPNRFCKETLTLKISNPDNQGYSEELTILLSGIVKTP